MLCTLKTLKLCAEIMSEKLMAIPIINQLSYHCVTIIDLLLDNFVHCAKAKVKLTVLCKLVQFVN